jgi:hypothetical protein
MRTRTTLTAVAVLAAGALLGWLSSNGLPPDVRAQDKQAAARTPYKFEGGYPTKEATQRARDDADFQRAVVAYHF